MSKVIIKTTIPKGKYCKDCGFLTDIEGYCFIYGYLKYYCEKEADYERASGCKLDYPDGKVVLVVEGEYEDKV